MKKIIPFIAILFCSNPVFALDFSLHGNGPCGGQICSESCTYTFDGKGYANVKITLNTKYTANTDGSVDAVSLMRIPGNFDGQENIHFGADGQIKTYLQNSREYKGRGERRWLRLDFAGAVAAAQVIKADSLADFKKRMDEAVKRGASQAEKDQITAQERFVRNNWDPSKVGADWLPEFGQSSPSFREDMNLTNFSYETLVSPLYFNFLVLRYLPFSSQDSVVYFTGGKHSAKENNTLPDTVLGRAIGSDFEWQSLSEVAGAKMKITALIDAGKHIKDLNFNLSYKDLGKIDGKLLSSSCQ